MGDYTPNLATIESAYVNWALLADRGIDASEAAAEFDRFIAKVKADALREAANALPKPVGLSCNTECHNVDWASLRVRADLIEREA